MYRLGVTGAQPAPLPRRSGQPRGRPGARVRAVVTVLTCSLAHDSGGLHCHDAAPVRPPPPPPPARAPAGNGRGYWKHAEAPGIACERRAGEGLMVLLKLPRCPCDAVGAMICLFMCPVLWAACVDCCRMWHYMEEYVAGRFFSAEEAMVMETDGSLKDGWNLSVSDESECFDLSSFTSHQSLIMLTD